MCKMTIKRVKVRFLKRINAVVLLNVAVFVCYIRTSRCKVQKNVGGDLVNNPHILQSCSLLLAAQKSTHHLKGFQL